ncbi:MAG: hypothetical protein KGZ25_13205, partial [Planctomycetes bacterium]|nr:hypothetical protein [Planctomycetota bacterium]
WRERGAEEWNDADTDKTGKTVLFDPLQLPGPGAYEIKATARGSKNPDDTASDTDTVYLIELDLQMQGLSEAAETDPGAFVAVNDNDNAGEEGTPDVQEEDLDSADPDLQPLRLALEAVPDAGTVKLSIPNDKIALWEKRSKTAGLLPESDATPLAAEWDLSDEDAREEIKTLLGSDSEATVYVEGLEPGRAGEITLSYDGTDPALEDRVQVTVVKVVITQAPDYLFANARYATPVRFEIGAGSDTVTFEEIEALIQAAQVWVEFWIDGQKVIETDLASRTDAINAAGQMVRIADAPDEQQNAFESYLPSEYLRQFADVPGEKRDTKDAKFVVELALRTGYDRAVVRSPKFKIAHYYDKNIAAFDIQPPDTTGWLKSNLGKISTIPTRQDTSEEVKLKKEKLTLQTEFVADGARGLNLFSIAWNGSIYPDPDTYVQDGWWHDWPGDPAYLRVPEAEGEEEQIEQPMVSSTYWDPEGNEHEYDYLVPYWEAGDPVAWPQLLPEETRQLWPFVFSVNPAFEDYRYVYNASPESEEDSNLIFQLGQGNRKYSFASCYVGAGTSSDTSRPLTMICKTHMEQNIDMDEDDGFGQYITKNFGMRYGGYMGVSYGPKEPPSLSQNKIKVPGPEGWEEIQEKAMDLKKTTAWGNIRAANGKFALQSSARRKGDDPMPKVKDRFSIVHTFAGAVNPVLGIVSQAAEVVFWMALENQSQFEGRSQATVQIWFQIHEENGEPQSAKPTPYFTRRVHNDKDQDSGDKHIQAGDRPAALNAGEQLTVWLDLSSQAQLKGWNTSGNLEQSDFCDAEAQYWLDSSDDESAIQFKLFGRDWQKRGGKM